MTITPEKYVRKPFYIDAVRVSQSNMAEVAQWCKGDIRSVPATKDSEKLVQYIQVKVSRPMKENQTRAFVGDWVLYAGKGWKVYTNRAFEACFEKVDSFEDKVNAIWQDDMLPLPIENEATKKHRLVDTGTIFSAVED